MQSITKILCRFENHRDFGNHHKIVSKEFPSQLWFTITIHWPTGLGFENVTNLLGKKNTLQINSKIWPIIVNVITKSQSELSKTLVGSTNYKRKINSKINYKTMEKSNFRGNSRTKNERKIDKNPKEWNLCENDKRKSWWAEVHLSSTGCELSIM